MAISSAGHPYSMPAAGQCTRGLVPADQCQSVKSCLALNPPCIGPRLRRQNGGSRRRPHGPTCRDREGRYATFVRCLCPQLTSMHPFACSPGYEIHSLSQTLSSPLTSSLCDAEGVKLPSSALDLVDLSPTPDQGNPLGNYVEVPRDPPRIHPPSMERRHGPRHSICSRRGGDPTGHQDERARAKFINATQGGTRKRRSLGEVPQVGEVRQEATVPLEFEATISWFPTTTS
jgi:hypothetical protein